MTFQQTKNEEHSIPIDIAKLGVNVNVNVSKDAVKPVTDPSVFDLSCSQTSQRLHLLQTHRMFPTTIIMSIPIDMLMAN